MAKKKPRRAGALGIVFCARLVLEAVCAQCRFSFPVPLPRRSWCCLHFTDEETEAQTCDDALKGTKLTGAGAQSLSSFTDALLKERERVPVLLSALSLNLRVYSEESEHTVEWIMGSIQASIAGLCKKMLLKLFT